VTETVTRRSPGMTASRWPEPQNGMFIGLVAGGLLASLDWRAVFWVNVPVGVFGTWWAYRRLRETSRRGGGRIDWRGNVTFAVGLGAILVLCHDASACP
jgi:MFS family permease